MKKQIITALAIVAMLTTNLAQAKGDDGGSSGSGSSGSSGTEDSSQSSSNSSSTGGLETETEHGVTFSVPSGVSGGDFVRDNFGATEAMEVETEHGLTVLKPHGASSNDPSTDLGLSSEGMEVETEHGVSFLKPHGENRDMALESHVSGRILLQVQANGEAWWIDPVSKARFFLGRPDDAFRIMRENGLGITNADLDQIAKSDDSRASGRLAKQLAGRILLQVESKGEAWFVDPVRLKRHYLGRPRDAFNVMRGLGLGITDDNLDKLRLKLGEVGNRKIVVALLPDNASGQHGYAEVKEIGNQVKVELILSGTPQGSDQPAHIHLGNRPSLGAVKYPLSNVKNGVSQTTLGVTFDQLLSERPLGINVHKSTAEMGISVASGNL